LPLLKKQDEVSISRCWRTGLEFDLVAEFLQSTDEALLGVLTISLFKVIAPELLIALMQA